VTDFADDSFIVICRADTDAYGQRGEYVLATRQVFRRRMVAEAYANGVAQSREPKVIAGRWHQLRQPVED
jgi:hypothetical protein